MAGRLSLERQIYSLLRTRSVKKRTIIVGLKSDNHSREMLLRLLNVVVKPGDNVIAIHVQEPFGSFDLNTFHTHEDLCKSKQVDFLIKICTGNSYIFELSQQVRINYATILAIGCSFSRPKQSVISSCLKGLPPTCGLLIIDNVGRIILQMQGTSQQGSFHVLPGSSISSSSSSSSSSTEKGYVRQNIPAELQKSVGETSLLAQSTKGRHGLKRAIEVPDLAKSIFQKLVLLEPDGFIRLFTLQDLYSATDNFSPQMVIGEGGNSKVYRANFQDGRTAAVKVVKPAHCLAEDLFQEVEILSSIRHDNIVQIIGYCNCKDLHAVVYNLMKGSLKQNLTQLKWSERMEVAIGVAKALDYLHSFNPPIIHGHVKSSNILLSENCQPQLSDFGGAMVYNKSEEIPAKIRPFDVVGTFGYIAPEYMMYGKVDEKIDVYSYGVVLLELITGKEAIQANQAKQESLVLLARSLLRSSRRPECLIDPRLNEDYVEEEMEAMMFAARLCLMHSSSRRPTMKMILRLFEEPGHLLKTERETEETRL
ncbi:pto-interacting protein 1 [Ricinus communis]|uniref:pto-interacting protein 1 n=1 Tax=Ricinus communis TaxID=3988 RepID=UPI00201AF542|nr:pto-interacting protein 1 [Ricinus communis]